MPILLNHGITLLDEMTQRSLVSCWLYDFDGGIPMKIPLPPKESQILRIFLKLRYFGRVMSAHEGPYIPADQEPKELTVRVLVVGVLLGILMTAANAYLGLYAGMTVSASIPAAVMSMLILRSMFKDVSLSLIHI